MGCACTIYPAYTSAAEILADNPDGIVLSDGPGDPWDNPEIIDILRELMKSGKPLFGWGSAISFWRWRTASNRKTAGGSPRKQPAGARQETLG